MNCNTLRPYSSKTLTHSKSSTFFHIVALLRVDNNSFSGKAKTLCTIPGSLIPLCHHAVSYWLRTKAPPYLRQAARKMVAIMSKFFKARVRIIPISRAEEI